MRRRRWLQSAAPAAAAERSALAHAALSGVRDGSLGCAGALDAARRASPGIDAAARADLAAVLCLCGAYTEAERALGSEDGREPPLVAAARGRLRLDQGRLIEARDALSRAGDGGRFETIDDLRQCARLLGDADGDHSSELAGALARGAAARSAGIINPAVLAWRGRAAEAALRLGERTQARELAQAELLLARAFGASRPVGAALRALGAVDDDERLLAEAVAVLEDSGAELELARARIALGAKLRRAGRRVDARELLRRGLDVAERLGAAPTAELAGQELRATGAKPRRDVLTGAAALTPSERRVAELAAAGLTNRQVAQELFVTMRTVTTHLTHIFQKLGIEGRDGIAPVLAADAAPPGAAPGRPPASATPAPSSPASGTAPSPTAEEPPQAAPAGDPEAVELLRGAARAALAAGEPERAVAHLRRALIEPPPHDLVAVVTAELGEAEAVIRDPAADARLAGCEGYAARLRLAEVRTLGGRPAAAREVLSAAARALGEEVEPGLLAPLESLRACLALGNRRFAADVEGRLALLRALSVAAGDAGRSLAAIDAFSQWRALRGGAAPALLDRGLAAARSAGVEREAVGGLMLAQLVGDDDGARAERAIDDLFEESRRRGAIAGVVLAQGWNALLALRSGEVTAALAAAQSAARHAASRDLGGVTPLVSAVLAEAWLARGAVAEAAAALEGVTLAGQEDSALAAFVHYARGLVHAAGGSRKDAIDELERCRSASAGLFVENPNVIPSRSALAVVIAADEASRARTLIDEELSLARRLRRPRAIGVALHAEALIAGDIDGLREAVGVLARAPAPLAHAHALADLAAALAAGGEPAADEVFADALAAALRCGATALADSVAAQAAAGMSGAAGPSR